MLGTCFFICAVIHLMVGARVFKNRLFFDIEVVFGIWGCAFVATLCATQGPAMTLHFLQGIPFYEVIFVCVLMLVCTLNPVLNQTQKTLFFIADKLPLPKALAIYITILIVAPLLGSFITEPAAMAVSASLLNKVFYKKNTHGSFAYATLGLLFANVSVGGLLTPYAAPPILMVASVWHWDLPFMWRIFAWKSVISITISTCVVAWWFRKEISAVSLPQKQQHLFRGPVQWKPVLMVAFFLIGLMVLGKPQRWWLEPLIAHVHSAWLYWGAIALTAVTDNAMLTYLGAQLSLSHASQYALVAGSVVGGGLTVIANAPNPVGYGILNGAFGAGGIRSWPLFLAACIPTAIAAVCFLCPFSI